MLQDRSTLLADDVEPVTDQSAEDSFRRAAEALGWREGGGYIYQSAEWDSWKEAVSWSGEEGWPESAIYCTWRECCTTEDIEIACVAVCS